MSYDAYATQVLAELELVPDYSTKRIVLIEAFKKVAEMERSGCAEIADREAKDAMEVGVADEIGDWGTAECIALAIRKRT